MKLETNIEMYIDGTRYLLQTYISNKNMMQLEHHDIWYVVVNRAREGPEDVDQENKYAVPIDNTE